MLFYLKYFFCSSWLSLNIRLVFLLVAFSRNNFFHENLSVKTLHTSNKNETGETYYSQWVNSRLPRSLLITIVQYLFSRVYCTIVKYCRVVRCFTFWRIWTWKRWKIAQLHICNVKFKSPQKLFKKCLLPKMASTFFVFQFCLVKNFFPTPLK